MSRTALNALYLHLWLVPAFSAIIWWTMLITLMTLWASEGYPNYAFETKPHQFVLYISDIGAGRYQPIFIAGSGSQGLLFVLSLASELYLRQTGRLRRHCHWWSMWCLWLSLAFATVGQLGILFVAIFDTKTYHDAHVSLLVVYIVFVGVSALFNVAASAALDRSYLRQSHGKIALWSKVLWFILELFLAVGFVGSQSFYINAPAILEWTISFIYPFYQLIMVWDLWPAIGKLKNHYPKWNENYPQAEDDVCPEYQQDLNDLLITPIKLSTVKAFPREQHTDEESENSFDSFVFDDEKRAAEPVVHSFPCPVALSDLEVSLTSTAPLEQKKKKPQVNF